MKKTAFSLLLLLACSVGFSQKAADFQSFNPRFEVFELPGGMLGNSVQSIVQDSAGFLWFASQEGLHRWDGQTFFTFRNDPLDSNSLISDYCEYIFLDSNGLIWLAHWNAGGLTAFDPATETFTRYRHDPNNPETLSGNTVSIIAEDHEGNKWVGGQSGLDRLDRKTGKFKRFGHNPADPRSLSYNQVRGLYVDKKGTLWVGTGFTWDPNDPKQKLGGLNRYDPKTETFTRYLHDPKDPTTLAHNHVRAMLEDSRGNFWVGTGGDGLQRMDRETGKFERLSYDPRAIGTQPSNPAKLSRPWLRGVPLAAQPSESHVSSLFEDRDGRIWITAVFGGLNVYDPSSGAVRHFETDKGAGNLSNNFLWQTFQSADGVFWISTGNGGTTVFKVTEQGERFPFFMPDATTPDEMVSDAVKDKAGNVWIGYFNKPASPLIRYDSKTGKSFPVPGGSTAPAPGGLNARSINTLLPDREGFLWIGTENGLFRHDPETGKFQHFPNPLTENSHVGNLLQDRNGYIWAYTWRSWLSRLDPKTGKYTIYRHDPANPGSIGGNGISGLYEDAKGNLWASGGSENDLNYPLFLDRFNPADGHPSFTHFIKETEAGDASNLTGDEQGNIWYLAFGGIQKLNPSDGTRQKFTAANSNLLTRTLTAMAKAKNGRFWINSRDGFVYELDPETVQFQAYGKLHGIPAGSQEVSEIYVAGDGEVLIGRAGGFIAFYPDSLRFEKSSRPPDVRITDFRLLEERVTPGDGSILKKPIWQTNELRLAHHQNVFSFSVACFDFTDPAANQLQFMLENYDKGWRKDLREGETPSYVNVPSGEYTFRVRGANSFGTWNMEGVSLRINISPPWWKTWWAYTFYGLLLLTGIYFFDRYQHRRIIQQERRRTLEMEAAQKQEIEKAYNALGVAHENLKSTQAQLIQSEKMASLGELTAGIAHEIQNPLNFVNNFSEVSNELIVDMVDEVDKGNYDEVKAIARDVQQNLTKINHHGKRASSIIKGMLEHSRKSSGTKEPTDINTLVEEYLRLAYQSHKAKDKDFNAELITDLDPNLPKIDVIPQDIGRVILNLITNAFYAVNERSKKAESDYVPTVSINTLRVDSPLGVGLPASKQAGGERGKGDYIQISVKDNGSGIPDAIKDKIFQPFFTTKPTGQGTGLGLSLAYDIVKAHGGELKVDSKEGEGTTFLILLKVEL